MAGGPDIVASAAPPAGRARCGCGHFPTHHMTVVADAPGRVGGFHMAPMGPCTVCGARACAKYNPKG